MTQAQSTRRTWFYGYVVVAACLVVMVFMWGAYNTFGVFLVPLTNEYGWSRTLVSGAFSVSTIVFGLVGIATGGLVDRWGPRLVVSVCGAASGAGYILLSMLTAPRDLYLALGILIGLGLAGTYVPLTTTVARWFVDRRGIMTGLVVAGSGIGGMVGAPTANYLIELVEWRTAYLLIGTAVLIFTVGAAQFLSLNPAAKGLAPFRLPVEGTVHPALEPHAVGLPLMRVVRLKVFWLLALIWFLHGFFGQGLIVHMFPHMTLSGINDGTAATVLGAIGAIGIAGSFLLGLGADRFGNRKALFVGYALCAASLGVMLIASSVLVFVIVAVVFGLGWYGIASIIPLVSAELFGMRELGVILGVIELAWAVGGGLGPVFLGAVFDSANSYSAGFIVAVILALASTALTATIKRSDDRVAGTVTAMG